MGPTIPRLPPIPEDNQYVDCSYNEIFVIDLEAIPIMESTNKQTEFKRIIVFIMVMVGITTLISIGAYTNNYGSSLMVAAGVVALLLIFKCYTIATMNTHQ